MMVAEVLSRLSRFVTLFVLAYTFTNADYGIAMLALVIHELFRVFTKLGTGAKIIQCRDEELTSTLENATSLQWLVAILTSLVQILSAELIASFYEMQALTDLLKIMALAHLFYPMVSTRIFEEQRKNRLRYYGIASGICIAFENLFIALLVALSASVMSVAFAKVAAAIFWVILFYRLPTQLRAMRFDFECQKVLMAFSFKTLTSELSRMLRFQADSLIAGRLLSPEVFGVYSFAKSAGLGIAQTFSQAYLSALYPFMCKQARQTPEAKSSQTIWLFTGFIGMLFLCQAVAAQFYIEWLFAERWSAAVDIASVLCLIAIPTLLTDHLGLSYRAANRPATEAKIILTCTLSLCAGYLAIAPQTPMAVALVGLVMSIITCCVCFTRMSFFKRQSDYRLSTP